MLELPPSRRSRSTIAARLPALLVLGAMALGQPGPAGADAEAIPSYAVANPTSAPVTAANVANRDRFWPFRIRLTEDWTPPGANRPVRPIAVLVRVNPDGTVRADFAGEGRHDVPMGGTDVVAAAERIRLGAETKMAPNLVLTIGNKLIDASRERVSIFHVRRDTPKRMFLCVFADPEADVFPALLEDLRAFRGREELQIALFPQTDALHDLGIGRVLRALDFTEPYVRARYRESFTRSLLADAPPAEPVVQLATVDGRLLFEATWHPPTGPRWPWSESWPERLGAAIDSASGR